MEDNITSLQQIKEVVTRHFKKAEKVKIINVGAKEGLGNFKWMIDIGKSVEVFNLEYDMNYVEGTEHSFYGDICSCPNINDNSFDIVYIYNVLEHVYTPWTAAQECIRICKPNGIIIVGAPFAWYYHKHPVDLWRFSHEGLKFLFEQNNLVKTLNHGFNGVAWSAKHDMPKAPGIQSLYVCKKL